MRVTRVEKTFKAIVLAFVLTAMTACVIVVKEGEGESDVEATWASSYSSTAEDDSLAENIGDGFDRDPTLSTEDLRVTVRRGVATLRGEVSDLAALERALDVAASVEGVRRVVSKLTLEVSTG